MRSQNAASLPFLLFFLLAPVPTIRFPYLSAFDARSVHLSLSFASATLVNFTIDDTSSLIAYSPTNSWRSSTVACVTCLTPNVRLAYASTWHDGTHIIPTIDDDDLDDTDENSVGSKTSNSSHATQSSKTSSADGKDDDSGNRSKGGSSATAGSEKRWIAKDGAFMSRHDPDDNPFFTPNLDSDDAGFVDTPVTAQFNFTGSAVYVFALVPLFAAATNSTPTFVNVTATLDSQQVSTFVHTGSPSTSSTSDTSYERSVPIFIINGLPEEPHTLMLNVGPDSVFLLDYIVYSQEDDFDFGVQNSGGYKSSTISMQPSTSSASGSRTTTPSAALSQATATTSASHSKSHNVATFAGAVGGSVGLLSFLALSLAFSIYRRRLLAQRRDRAYRDAHRDTASISDSFHTDASEDGPPMQGPAPFVPRYFPGTVINTAPPPYSPPAPSSSSPSSALLGTPEAPESPIPSMSWSSRRFGIIIDGDTSYADRPPPTPPGADWEDGYFAPPPSFPVAISTPVPAILAGLSGVPSAPQSPEPRPDSPVVPLLAPPPSSRLHSVREEAPVAGPSDSQDQPASTVPSSRVSVHSIPISSRSLRRQPSSTSTRTSASIQISIHSGRSIAPPTAEASEASQTTEEVQGESSTDDDRHSTRL